ncbi:MAG TPA: hypothetical protein VHI98_26385 [Vicinamibacterales bacterium]|jgi:hypothetical protein|nr:hypothetical protein [Vicinamibacterales bacterium]
MTPTDLTGLDAAVKRVSRLATRLGSGDPEGHVRRSLAELTDAIGKQEQSAHAVDRLVQSLRQLQSSRDRGRRRDQQRGAVGIERVLESIQEDLLPRLRHV